MKVAVCVSGLCGGRDVQGNIDRIKRQFPFDMFFATWEEYRQAIERELPGTPYITCPEPKMHYHPTIDSSVGVNLLSEPFRSTMTRALHRQKQSAEEIERKLKSGALNPKSWTATKFKSHTKQILCHAHIVSQLPPEYDMIIRTRYDVFVSPEVNFLPLLEQSYNQKRAIGFAIMPSKRQSARLNKLEVDTSNDYRVMLFDYLIMHRRDMFDTTRTWKLHEEKALLPCEYGWYQTLSNPYSSNHLCVHGGVQLQKMLKTTLK